MKEQKEKYLQFPLFIIREMLINKEETINKIIHYCIYKYASKFNYTIEDAIKNLMYFYYRKQKELTTYLTKTIENYIEIKMLFLDYDYNGFDGQIFDPDFEKEQLMKIFEKDIEFKSRAIEFYQMQLSYNSLGINGNIENCLKKGIEIENQIPISVLFLYSQKKSNH